MASERDKAKSAIKNTDSADPELNAALAEGTELQHRLMVESNRHKEAMRSVELGLIGRLVGGEANAPIAVATIVVVAGIAGACLSVWMASQSQRPDSSEYWSKMIERFLALTISGLSFIFGRSGRR
jgi:hypothetical protein